MRVDHFLLYPQGYLRFRILYVKRKFHMKTESLRSNQTSFERILRCLKFRQRGQVKGRGRGSVYFWTEWQRVKYTEGDERGSIHEGVVQRTHRYRWDRRERVFWIWLFVRFTLKKFFSFSILSFPIIIIEPFLIQKFKIFIIMTTFYIICIS